MCPHEVAPTTHSLEMTQIQQINQHLAGDASPPRAQDLGLTGAAVHPDHVDTVAAHRTHLPVHLFSSRLTAHSLRAEARLLHLVAAGSPTFPYIYGLFTAETGARLLPVTLHTEQLRKISAHYRLHHRWGT